MKIKHSDKNPLFCFIISVINVVALYNRDRLTQDIAFLKSTILLTVNLFSQTVN